MKSTNDNNPNPPKPWFGRYAANVFSGYGLKAIQLILSLIAIPVLLSVLGERDYGWLIFLSTTVGYFGILNLGISDAMSRYVAEYWESGDTNELRRLVSTVVILFVGIGCLAASAIMLAICFRWSVENELTLKLLFALTGILYIFAWPLLAIRGVYVGLQRQPYLSSALGLGRIIAVSVAITGALLGWNLPIVFLAMNLDQLVLPAILVARLRKYIPGRLIHPSYFDLSSIKKILSFSSWLMLSRVATFLEYQVDTLLVLVFVGPSGVALYTVICTPFRMIQQLSGIAVAAIVPVIAGMGDDVKYAVKTIRAGALAHNAMIASGCVLVYLFADTLLAIWLDGKFSDSYWLIKTLILFQVVWQSNAFLGGCINGLGHSKSLGLVAVATGVLNFCISIFLVQSMGTEGVVVGTLAAGLIAVPFATWIFPPLAGIGRMDYLEVLVLAHLPAIVLGLILLLFRGNFPQIACILAIPFAGVSTLYSFKKSMALVRSTCPV